MWGEPPGGRRVVRAGLVQVSACKTRVDPEENGGGPTTVHPAASATPVHSGRAAPARVGWRAATSAVGRLRPGPFSRAVFRRAIEPFALQRPHAK